MDVAGQTGEVRTWDPTLGVPGTVVSFLSSGRLLLEPEEWQSAYMAADIGGQIDAAVGCQLCGAVAHLLK